MLNDYRFDQGQFCVSLTQISFSGTEVKTFLQSQSTYDVEKVCPGQFQLISFLDPQGRLEFYSWLVLDEQYCLWVPNQLVSRALDRLNKFLISEDVIIHDPIQKNVTFLIGPFCKSVGAHGVIFNENTRLIDHPVPDVKTISDFDIKLWRQLSGWPDFEGHTCRQEIINNLRLFDLSLSLNKGCYPGQETVSKIATRRGAAYSEVLIELNSAAPIGEINNFGKKIGSVLDSFEWMKRHFVAVNLIRDFRVDHLPLRIEIQGREYDGVVRYYPLISGDPRIKAQELFDLATDDFKLDHFEKAEEKFRLAIKIDPTYADAYEGLGVMLGRLGRYEEAINLMEALSEIDPSSVLAHTNLSVYLMKLGKIQEAEEQKSIATVKSFQSFGEQSEQQQLETHIQEKQKKEWTERESMFFQVLEIDPEDTLANYGLGSIYVEKKEWERARSYLEKVIQVDPKYSVAYLALGSALKGLGLIEDAKKIWTDGVRVAASKGDLMPANQMQQEIMLISK